MKTSARAILAELDRPGAGAAALLQARRGETYAGLWRRSARLYRDFGKRLIEEGHPTRAFELLREGVRVHPRDAAMRYLEALALARGGARRMASDRLQRLLAAKDLSRRLRVEALSLSGRLAKDAYQRTRPAARRRALARESAGLYTRAHDVDGDPFPGINAATMTLLSGNDRKSRGLARRVVERTRSRLRRARDGEHWLWATLGEAHCLLGDLPQAIACYGKAVRRASRRAGDVASMRRNLLLLAEKVDVADEILALLSVGEVLVFTGHMIDHPQREQPPRFPPGTALERRVIRAIEAELERLRPIAGYVSAACGSDLLFAECMLGRRRELHVVLPFDADDFRRTSVDFGQRGGKRWLKRFEAVLEGATEVHEVTGEPFLGDRVLFEFGSDVMQGLALNRARELGTGATALAVVDGDAKALPGGAVSFVREWTRAGREVRRVDLGTLREGLSSAGSGSGGRGRRRRRAGPASAGTRGRRRIRAMLFADVKNFSKLDEARSPEFFARFLNEVRGVLRRAKVRPAFINTWGDGLYVVFDRLPDAAEFATRLQRRMERVDWSAVGMPGDTAMRIGMHAGPVYRRRDPILGRTNFFGSHVTRAARIEPVTIPGCIYTSEPFAAALAAEPGHDFRFEYVGVEALAKGYDRCRLYRLEREE